MTNSAEPALDALHAACVAVTLDARDAEPIRLAENQIWRLPEGVIARIALSDRALSAAREIKVAKWLASNGIPVVKPLLVEQPLQVAGRVVTFWDEVPPHSHGSIEDVASALKALHSLPLPSFSIGRLDPFVRVPERLAAARTLPAGDRRWLAALYEDLLERWNAGLPEGLPERAVHGDAWPVH